MSPNLQYEQSGRSSTWDTLLSLAAWGAMLLGLVLLLGVWLPNRARFKSLETQTRSLLTQIAEESRHRSVSDMQHQITQAYATEAQLRAEMSYWIERRNTFSCPSGSAPPPVHQDDGRIDFKIALFNARTNMVALAESRQAHIPTSLGIDETLSTDTRVETALSQLSATVRLVKRTLDAGIQEIDSIQPLPPRMKTLQDDTFGRLREYPISLGVKGTFQQCMALLSLLADPENGYALQHISVEKTTHQIDDPALSLQLVVTAGRPLLPLTATEPLREEAAPVPLLEAGTPRRFNAKPKPMTNGIGPLGSLTNLSMAEDSR